MNLFALVASFGGGIIGAYMGALPAFILTGVIAIAGSVAAMAGGADMTVGLFAFGPILVPISPLPVVWRLPLRRQDKEAGQRNGHSVLSEWTGRPCYAAGRRCVWRNRFSHSLSDWTVLHLNTDLPGFTVILSAVIARLVFGSGGLIGKAAPGESREYFTSGRGMLCNVILGLGLGTTTGFVYQALLDGGASAVVIGSYPVLCFGIAAVSLIFAQTGFAMPATHHIALISALAAVSSQNPVMGIVFGILTALFGDFVGKTFNSCCDTHIDPPAFTIFVFTFIVNIIFGSGFFSV